MTRFRIHLLAALALAGSACGNTTQTIVLQSLEASGRSSFLCLNSETFGARSLDDCPDIVPDAIDGEDRHLYSLVTQTTRGEVAVVDLTAGTVVDEDVSVPGFSFLPIGAKPTGIVSTPGSMATFVGVAELKKEGIFAIPSSCVKPRQNGGPVADLTTWPACRLPVAPADLAILIDPPANPSTPEVLRPSCDGTPDENESSAQRRECPADLSLETRPPGRRKLAVSLPDLGEIAILDAQRVLNLPPGSFEPCPVESYVPLAVDLPKVPILQQLPPDLVGKPRPIGLVHPPVETTFVPQPTDFAQLDDPITQEHRLYVADGGAPVIHVLDTSDPCRLTETAPLLPLSFNDPERTVLTTRVAVSPLTSDQQRFLYAVDGTDAQGGGSVMMFDVSPDSSNRTPLLRSNSPNMPFEPPDRIAFDAPARDVTFALHDDLTVNLPASPPAQPIGVECDPDPAVPSTVAGGRYRPTLDLSSGARPAELRGVFGFVALETGQVSVIDVDDFDAKCRRPTAVNRTSTPDFRGCANEVLSPRFQGFVDASGVPTVTNEATCNVVETNRARSVAVLTSDPTFGVHAPSLRQLPKLVDDSGRTLATDHSTAGSERPHLLAVNFSDTTPAQVYVGTDVYAAPGPAPVLAGAGPDARSVITLQVDPKAANESSLVLDLSEPRAYLPDEVFTARFEGPFIDTRPAGTFVDQGGGIATLTDGGVEFCDQGVEDENAACERGLGLGIPGTNPDADCHVSGHPAGERSDNLGKFAVLHADYVQLISDIPAQTNDWWQGGGTQCSVDPAEAGGYDACNTLFGTSTAPATTRDLHIISATRNALTVRPRAPGAGSKNATLINQLITCCFPGTVAYRVRASDEWVVRGSNSGFRNDITSDSTGNCVVDDDPLRARLNSRAIETSCSDCVPADSIGPPNPGEVACIFTQKNLPPQTLGAPQSQCIFQGLTTNFAIYGGQRNAASGALASQRDMEFDWEIIGGFSPLVVNVSADGSINVSPQSIQFMPQIGSLVVADGSSKGLVLVDLSTFAVTTYQ